MSNPNQPLSFNDGANSTEWDSLMNGKVEFAPISIPTDEVSKIKISDAPMGKGRQDKRVDVVDANGMEKRTSSLMLGYNKDGVQIGEAYLSIEQFRKAALKSLNEDREDSFLYFVRKGVEGTERCFAEPREVVEDMVAAIIGVGPEATLSSNTRITNQDARSVEFSSPARNSYRGVFMLGNDGIEMPDGLYAEAGTIDRVTGEYAKVTQKEDPVPPREIHLPPEQVPNDSEIDGMPNEDLHQATLDLAELYAKNRRLIAGPGVREQFETARQEYQRLLVEHLSKFGHAQYNTGFESLSTDVQSVAVELAEQNVSELTAFVGGDLEHPNKTPEEIEAKREELRRVAEAKMSEKYFGMVGSFETAVNSSMIAEYARLRSELEDATIDALDNGTACRKVVSKIITNKWVKRGLTAAAAAGLAVAAVGIGRGVVDGSLAVSLGYTAGGVAAGAIRGGLVGALMSRQDSKTSAIRSYSGDIVENVEKGVEGGEHITARELASEAMSDYADANQADLHSNRAKTAVSTGIGAAIGAAASGVHVDNVTRSTTTERVQTGAYVEQVQTGTATEQVQTGTSIEQIQTGTTPEQYSVDLSRIDIRNGSGLGEVFTDLGGDPTKISEAVRIAQQFDAQHGMVPGSNGVVPGVGGQIGEFAHTYPGTIDTWPQQARDYITQVAQKWAEGGLVDGIKIGGEPIFSTVETPIYANVEVPIYANVESPVFSTVEKTVISYLPNLFYNALAQAEAAAISGTIGSVSS